MEVGRLVSILTRRFRRVQPLLCPSLSARYRGFQSSPDVSAGCNLLDFDALTYGRWVSILTRRFRRVQRRRQSK